MPRASDGTWSDIPNITAVPGQTIESADWNGYRADLRQNEFNAARPIVAGGTGATTPEQALTNLGGVGVSNFLDAYAVGDFYETIRTLDANWLRRNGGLYAIADYPELAALLPALTDNVEWSSLPISAVDVQGILVESDRIIVANRNGVNSNVFISTDDGASFAQVATLNNFVAEKIIKGNGIYLALDGNGKAAISNNAVNWGAPFTPTGFAAEGITDGAFGNNRFVIVGTAGKISSSADGNTWAVETSGTASLLYSVRFVNNLFLVTGNNGVILTSPEGDTWTSRASGVTVALNASAYGNGLYTVVGEVSGGAAVILTSTNLGSWIPRSSGAPAALKDVVYSTSGYVAVGSSGVARISGNGTNWSSVSTGVSQDLNVVAFDPDQQEKYFAGGGANLIQGIRTLPTQFRVPSDNPTYGWIRAVPLDD